MATVGKLAKPNLLRLVSTQVKVIGFGVVSLDSKGQPPESKAQATRKILYEFESNLVIGLKYEFYKQDWHRKIHPLILIQKSNLNISIHFNIVNIPHYPYRYFWQSPTYDLPGPPLKSVQNSNTVLRAIIYPQ